MLIAVGPPVHCKPERHPCTCGVLKSYVYVCQITDLSHNTILNVHMFYNTRHSGDRYNRSNHSSGAIPSDNHKYFETESEHELWEKWRLQFVEDSPHGYSKCSVCKIFQLNDCMNLGTLWNNILRYLGIIHCL